jgi:hypothetical protein
MSAIMNSIAGSLVPALSSSAGAVDVHLPMRFSGTENQPAQRPRTPFFDLLTDAVGQVNQLEDQAHTAVTGLMSGDRRGRASGDDCYGEG